jgi:hypothetical protein
MGKQQSPIQQAIKLLNIERSKFPKGKEHWQVLTSFYFKLKSLLPEEEKFAEEAYRQGRVQDTEVYEFQDFTSFYKQYEDE